MDLTQSKYESYIPNMEPILLPVGPTEPQCGSMLLPQEGTQVLSDPAFDLGLVEKSNAAPHLDGGAAVPLSQLCCSRPSRRPWPLLAAAPLLAGACTRLPDPRLAEAPRSGRCLTSWPRASLLLLGISHAAASIKALPLLCSSMLTMRSPRRPVSVVTAALLLHCSRPPQPGSFPPTASVVTAALLLHSCRQLQAPQPGWA